MNLSEVDAERRADVALDAVFAAERQWHREHRRPRTLAPREALAALQFEALLVWTAARNIANGVGLADSDLDRLTLACRRIDALAEEATR